MKFNKVLSRIFERTLKTANYFPIKTIVFCDPGLDDALMLLQLLSSANYQVVGIIPVTGNASCRQTVLNTLNLCELIGRTDICIYPGTGYDKNTKYQNEKLGFYGKNGLGAIELPTAEKIPIQPQSGVEFVCEALGREKHLLISTAALTDLAKILQKLSNEHPSALKNIIASSMMGGVINPIQEANWPATGKRSSEANIGYDASASKIIFDTFTHYQIPIILAPLDLTHSILASRSDLLRLKEINNPAAKLAVQLIESVPLSYQKYYQAGPDKQFRQPLHDVHAVHCLLHPELYYGQWVSVKVSAYCKPQQITITNMKNGNIFLLDCHYLYRQQFFSRLVDDLQKYFI